MEERKVFCEGCRNDVTFTINEKKMEGTIKGEKYSYIGKEAHCVDCGSEIYVAEVNDLNLKALYDAYREKNNIVSLEVILAIQKNMQLGKTTFSLLGWENRHFLDIAMEICQQSSILKFCKSFMMIQPIMQKYWKTIKKI